MAGRSAAKRENITNLIEFYRKERDEGPQVAASVLLKIYFKLVRDHLVQKKIVKPRFRSWRVDGFKKEGIQATRSMNSTDWVSKTFQPQGHHLFNKIIRSWISWGMLLEEIHRLLNRELRIQKVEVVPLKSSDGRLIDTRGGANPWVFLIFHVCSLLSKPSLTWKPYLNFQT